VNREKTAAPSRREEVEVKIPSADLARAREKLREADGRLRAATHFESNDLFDDARGTLAAAGCALRLRRTDTQVLLTFKGPARFENGVKIRQENETRVSDVGQTEAILAGLGYARRFRYEKRREEWELEGCVVALDETPIGSFVEVEGTPPAIRRVVSQLGLDFASAVPYTYAKLYAERRKADPALPEDMVFPPAS
jgi:adenylate cyclase class 2